MAKVKDVLGQRPEMQINKFKLDSIDPQRIWSNYDSEADSVVIYLTGAPQPAVSVYVDDNIYLMVDPQSRNVVGFHVEAWERKFVPAHSDVQAIWPEIKRSLSSEVSWNHLLRMLALWTIFIVTSGNGYAPIPEPA
jgi:hypothetical protein